MKISFFNLSALSVALLGLMACGAKNDGKIIEADTETATMDTATPVDSVVDSATPAPDTVSTLEDSTSVQAQELPMTPQEAKASKEFKSTASGLKYRVLREGTGRTPKPTDMVLVNYEGKLMDGTIFDSSYVRGQPINFPLNQVIPGWTEGLQLMKEGAEYEFIIPYQLAYGAAGASSIPPKSDLYFRVEFIQIL